MPRYHSPSVIPSAARNPSENLNSAKNPLRPTIRLHRQLLGFGPVRETRLAPLQRFAVTAPIFVSFALKRRNKLRLALVAQRNERQISAGGVASFARERIFREHFHSDFQ